jgi:hypothetical protein
MLKERGCYDIVRWGEAPRLDHEASLADYRADLAALLELFEAVPDPRSSLVGNLFAQAEEIVASSVAIVELFEEAVDDGLLSPADAMAKVIGQGHHRVWARKG